MKLSASQVLMSALLVATVSGCAAAPVLVAPTAPAGDRLSLLSGEDAIEDGQVRVKVVDQSRGGSYKLQALPTTWTHANLRLISNSNFGNKLTGDRVVSLPLAAFTPNGGNTAYQTQATSIFTKMRPGTYLFQISLDDQGATPFETKAVQSVSVTVTGGATTNLVITLQTTDTGTNTINAVSTGTETYASGNPASGNLNNSTAHAVANFALVEGDTISLDSPLLVGDLKANTQSTTPNVSAVSPVNGTVSFANGQVSRVVASLRSGSGLTVTSNVPTSDEKIVAIWYATGNEARTNTAWSSFYGSGADTAGIVPAVSETGVTPIVGLTTAFSFTVPGASAAASGPNGAGVPSLALNTTEAGTAADINGVLIYRFYDNTFEHRYIGAKTRTLALADDASIQATVN